MTHLYVGHRPDSLASGRPLAFGDEVVLAGDDVAANERLIRDELLVPASAPDTPAKPKARPAPQPDTPSEEE